MEIRNYFALAGFIFLTIGVITEARLIPRLVKELKRRPKDEFTDLTWRLLARPVIYVTTFLPFIPQLAVRTQSPPLSHLGAWVTVSVPLGLMLLAFTTYSSYTYKEKRK